MEGTFTSLFEPFKQIFVAFKNLYFSIFIFLVFLIFLVLIIKKIVDNRRYDILAEVVPYWSIAGKKISDEDKYIIKKKKTLFGTKEIKIPVSETEIFISNFYPAKYIFNKKTGTFDIHLKDREKTVIPDISYKFFVPINFGKFKRYIKLVRYSPNDYKPVLIKFDLDSLKEVRSIYDSEATYIALKTKEEINKALKGESIIVKMLPYFVVMLCLIVFLIGVFILKESLTDNAKMIGSFTSSLEKLTEKMVLACK